MINLLKGYGKVVIIIMKNWEVSYWLLIFYFGSKVIFLFFINIILGLN